MTRYLFEKAELSSAFFGKITSNTIGNVYCNGRHRTVVKHCIYGDKISGKTESLSTRTVVPIVRINFCISGYQKLGCLDETTAKMDAVPDLKAGPKTGILEINIEDGNSGFVSQLNSKMD